jgi:hypothetical protein
VAGGRLTNGLQRRHEGVWLFTDLPTVMPETVRLDYQ